MIEPEEFYTLELQNYNPSRYTDKEICIGMMEDFAKEYNSLLNFELRTLQAIHTETYEKNEALEKQVEELKKAIQGTLSLVEENNPYGGDFGVAYNEAVIHCQREVGIQLKKLLKEKEDE